MSILKLSEDLKDVPDHFLVSEVRQPTGSYPGYLVVAELERRKGMRDRYLKEAPKSTVVDDLSQPNREQMMSAVAQMQQPQQQPLPPQMPPQMPLPPQIPQMPASGLMATPQASSLAATDAVASPRKRMAGGGLVAFQEGGDVKRFAGGGPPSWEELPDPPLSAYSMLGDPRRRDPRTGAMLTKRDYEMMLDQDRSSGLQTPATPSPAQAVAGNYMPQQKASEAFAAATAKTNAAAGTKTPIADQAASDITAKSKGPAKVVTPSAAIAAPVSPQQQMPFPAVPTDEQLAAVGQKAISTFGQNVPQRFSETEKEIGRRTQNLKDRRSSAQNEALMMAGLGILKSRSPGRWLGEGGEEGMLAYRQNMTNVRAGEDAMTDVKQNLAHQQLMQDLAQQQIGQSAQQRALDMYRYGSDARYQQGQLANAQEQNRLTGLLVPAQIFAATEMGKYHGGLGEYYRSGAGAGVRAADIDPRVLIKAQEQAAMELISQKNKPGYAEKLRELTNQYIANMNQTGMQGTPPQAVNRNPNPNQVLGLP